MDIKTAYNLLISGLHILETSKAIPADWGPQAREALAALHEKAMERGSFEISLNATREDRDALRIAYSELNARMVKLVERAERAEDARDNAQSTIAELRTALALREKGRAEADDYTVLIETLKERDDAREMCRSAKANVTTLRALLKDLEKDRDSYKRSHEASSAALAEKIAELQDARNFIAGQEKDLKNERALVAMQREDIKKMTAALSSRQENADLLELLVRAKDLKDRGKTDEYEKAKEGLWERAFAYCNMPMPKELFCPKCGKGHVDGFHDNENWAERPHKTHQCQYCKHEWRPFEYPTVGVQITRTAQSTDPQKFDAELGDLVNLVNPNVGIDDLLASGAPVKKEPERNLSVREKIMLHIKNAFLDKPGDVDRIFILQMVELIGDIVKDGIDYKRLKNG